MTPQEKQSLIDRAKSDPAFRKELRDRLLSKKSERDSIAAVTQPETSAQDALSFEDDQQKIQRAQEIRDAVDRYGSAPVISTLLGKPSEAHGAFDVGRQSFAESLTGIPFTAGIPQEEAEAHKTASQVGSLLGFATALAATRKLPFPSFGAGRAAAIPGFAGELAGAAARDAVDFMKLDMLHKGVRATTGTLGTAGEELDRSFGDIATGAVFGAGGKFGEAIGGAIGGATGKAAPEILGRMGGQSAAFAGTAAGLELLHGEVPTLESVAVNALFGPVIGIMKGSGKAGLAAVGRISNRRSATGDALSDISPADRGKAIADATREQVAEELSDPQVQLEFTDAMRALDPVNGEKKAQIIISRVTERNVARPGVFQGRNGRRYIVNTSVDEAAGTATLDIVDNKGIGIAKISTTPDKVNEKFREVASRERLKKVADISGPVDTDAIADEVVSRMGMPETVKDYARLVAKTFSTAEQKALVQEDSNGNPIPDNIAQPLKRNIRRVVLDRMTAPKQEEAAPQQTEAKVEVSQEPAVKIGDVVSVEGDPGDHLVTGVSKKTGNIIYAPNGDKSAKRKTSALKGVSVVSSEKGSEEPVTVREETALPEGEKIPLPDQGKVVTLPGETEEQARARMAEDEIGSMQMTREQFADGKKVEDQNGIWVRYDGPIKDKDGKEVNGYTIFDPNTPELQGKSFNESDLEKAGYRAFEKVGESYTPDMRGVTEGGNDVFGYQDSHGEKVVHSKWEKGNEFRYDALEGAGDILRELSAYSDGKFSEDYLAEKIGHIERALKNFDRIFEEAKYGGGEKLREYIEAYESQPTKTPLQEAARQLNIALAKGDKEDAKRHLDYIKKQAFAKSAEEAPPSKPAPNPDSAPKTDAGKSRSASKEYTAAPSGLVMVPVSDIQVGEGFQPRSTEVADATIESLRGGIKPTMWKPIDVIEVDGKLYTANHTRLRFANELMASGELEGKYPNAKDGNIPVRIIKVEDLAKDMNVEVPETIEGKLKLAEAYSAVYSNQPGQEQTELEFYNAFVKLGKDLFDRASPHFDKTKRKRFEALSNLDQNGMFANQAKIAMNPNAEERAATGIKNFASWVGELRGDEKVASRMNDRHEQEVYNFLYNENGKLKNTGWNKKPFQDFIRNAVEDKSRLPESPLNLDGRELTTGTKYNANTQHLWDKIASLRSHLESTKNLYNSGDIPDDVYVSSVKAITDQIKKLQASIEEVDKNQGKLNLGGLENPKSADNPELSLEVFFGVPNPQAIGRMMKVAKGALARQLSRYQRATNVNSFDKSKVEVFGKAKDMGIIESNINTPAFAFGYPGDLPKHGAEAQKAQLRMMLTERDIFVDINSTMETLTEAAQEALRADRGEYKNFSKHIEAGPGSWGGLNPKFQEALAKWRAMTEVLQERVKNHIVEKYVRSYIHAFFPKRFFELVDVPLSEIALMPAESKADKHFLEVFNSVLARTEEKYSGWGIENYFHHLFEGNFKIHRVEDKEKGTYLFVGSARSRAEAMAIAEKNAVDSEGKYKAEDYSIQFEDGFIDPVLEVTDPRLHNMTRKIADALGDDLSKPIVEFMLSGTVKSKATKSKFASALTKRAGVTGYEEDPVKVASAYTRQIFRAIHLSRLSGQVEKAARDLRRQGKPIAAEYLESNLKYLWGKAPGNFSKQVDNLAMRLPVVGQYVHPGFLERSGSRMRGIATTGALKISPRYHVVNSLQTLQTLWPDAPSNVPRSRATAWLDSHAGKSARDRFGVRFLMRGKHESWEIEHNRIFSAIYNPKTVEKITDVAPAIRPEARNQEVAWATYYLDGLDKGMTENDANDYAFLMGNIHSQFFYMTSNQPGLLRNEAIKTFGGQWKRFSIQNLEYGIGALQNKRYSSFTRWVGMQLILGGLKPALRVAQIAAAPAAMVGLINNLEDEEIRVGLQKQFGNKMGNMIFYGMPALVNADLSASFNMIDMPFGNTPEEQLFNTVTGFPGTTIMGTARAMRSTSGIEPSSVKRGVRKLSQSVSGLRWINALESYERGRQSGEYNTYTPDGQIKAATDLASIIREAMAIRSTEKAAESLIASWIIAKDAERNRRIDQIAIKFLAGDDINEDLEKWNEDSSSAPISFDNIKDRAKSKAENAQKTERERIRSRLPNMLRPILDEKES